MSRAREVTLWTVCQQCRHIEGWVIRDDRGFDPPPCELCGSPDITRADYHPEE